MKPLIQKLLKHPLIYGSTVVVFGNLLANFINFLFNLFMSRSLSVTDYGILASITSLVGFPALMATAVNPLVIRFAGDYFVKNDLAHARGLYIKLTKFLLGVGGAFFLVYLLNINHVANFFHITNQQLLFLAGTIMVLSLIGIINLAFLQAKLAFGMLTIVSFTSAVIKLLLGVFLVLLGYSVNGAVSAMTLGAIASYLFSFYPLRFLFASKVAVPKIKTSELFKYGIPSALTLLGLTSFLSVDIILAKHFFEPYQAGLYAGLSLIGRIIFFVTAPIGSVMFSVIVRKHSNNENYQNTFRVGMLLVLSPAIILTTSYFLLPSYVIEFFLKRSEYQEVAPLLGIFGLYITSYCLLYMLATFYLSIKKTKVFIPIVFGALLQIVLINIYHSTMLQFVIISSTIILVLVVAFLLYYPYATKK